MIRLKSLINENVATADSIAWAKKFKQDLGLSAAAAAAMAANIQHESGFIPHRIQGSGIKTGTLADSGNLGYSWAQWTFGPRKQNFRNYVKQKFNIDIAKRPATNDHAYSFLKHEVQRYPGFDFNRFKQENDVDKATEEFVSKYEQAGKPMLANRQAIARDILSKIKGETDIKDTADYSYIGKTVYPRKTSKHDYANVRSEPVINNGLFDNIVATIKWPNAIGVVEKRKVDSQGKAWYYVKMAGGEYGWVRFDVITRNKNEKFI